MEIQSQEREVRGLTRRSLLKLSPLLLLGGLAVPKWQGVALSKGQAFADWAASKWFRPGHLAPTYADSELTPLAAFPLNTYDVDDPGVDLDSWKLEVSGEVAKPGEYRLADIQALPKQVQNTRHICVEGWDVVGRFGGTRISEFLKAVGADAEARFLYVECADDYYETLDMAAAMHAQSLLCYEMYDEALTREHGAPLRLSVPTKIGYKQAKYLTKLRVSKEAGQKGYWEDQGYSAYYGL